MPGTLNRIGSQPLVGPVEERNVGQIEMRFVMRD